MKTTFLLFFLSVILTIETSAQWFQADGMYGGDIRAIQKVGNDIFAGSQYGGIFRSTDDGATWSSKFNGLPGGVAITSITGNTEYLYAGTGYWSLSGMGVYRSADGGNSWEPKNNGIEISGSFNDMNITGLALTTNHIFASTKANGIYRSSNNGESWTKVFDVYGPDSVYREVNGLTYSNGYLFAGSTGIYRSSDNGITWDYITTGLPAGIIIYQLTSHGTDVYITSSHGFFWSDNNGSSWVNISNGITTTTGCKTLFAEGNILYCSTYDGTEGPKTYKSENKGITWEHVTTLSNVYVMALFKSGTTVLAGNIGNYNIAANGGGLMRSTDNGITWTQSNTGLSAINVMCLSADDTQLYAGTRYYSGVYSSPDGISWNKSLVPGTTPNQTFLSIKKAGSNLYTGVNSSGVYVSSNNGQSWAATSSIGLPVYALDANSNYIFAGTSNQGMRRSSNNGTTWTTINTGLPTIGEKSIRAIAIDGSNIFIGTSRGVFLSTNDGTNWSAANGGIGSPGYGQVKAIAVKGDTLFGGNSNGIIRSFDKGTTWSLISSAISIGNTNALFLEGSRLYAGGKGGVFCSDDWGETWNTLNGTFPMTSEVYSLLLKDGVLYAGTYGQSLWYLLNPLTPAPQAFAVTGSGDYCEGSAGRQILLTGSELNVTYKLTLNGTVIETLQGTGNPLDFGYHTSGVYNIVAYGIGGIVNMATSVVINEIPNSPVNVVIAADQDNVCEGTIITFTATPQNGGTPVYQWYHNGMPSGINSNQYMTQPVAGDEIYVVMTSDLACTTNNPASSNILLPNINTLMPVSIQISTASNNVCTSTEVTVTAQGVNAGSNPLFQWYLNGNATGTNQPSFTFIPANNDEVYAVLTSDLECASANPAASDTLVFTVTEPSPVSVTISADQNNVCVGTTVNLSASITNGGQSPGVDWYVNGVLSGLNQPAYSFVPNNNDEIYSVVTSDEYCVSNNPAISDTITFIVNDPVAVSVSIVENLNNFCGQQEVTLTATPVNGGSSPEYIWYVNAYETGGNDPTFTYIPENGDEVYVVMISNLECSTGSPVASNFVVFNIEEELTPAVTITASENPVVAGNPVTFTAIPENGGNPAFEWYVNDISVSTGPTFTYIPNDGDVIYVILTTSLECVTTTTASSNSVIIDVITSSASVSLPGIRIFSSGNNIFFENIPANGVKMEIVNLNGKLVYSMRLNPDNNISGLKLPTGVYLVRLINRDEILTTKIPIM